MFRTLLFAALWRSSAALLVADGSPCATKCGNVLGSTTDDMIVCDESAYSTSTNGQVFEACVGCETTSTYSTGQGQQETSDLGFACKNIMNAIQYGNLSSSDSTYAYCDMWTDYLLDKCHACLSLANEHYLSNYISILDGACRLRLEPPATLPLQGNVFSTDVVNVTDPTPTATFAPTGITGPLDSGAIAGIVIGGLAVLLAVVGCGIVLNGKRRRKAYLRRREEGGKPWPRVLGGGGNGNGNNGNGDMFETPISQKPLRGGWGEDSPVSAATQTTFPPYFSPYSSQYNSPVSAVDGGTGGGPGGYQHMAWPAEKMQQNIGVAISPDREVVSPWDDRKGKEKAVADDRELREEENGNGAGAGGYGFPIPPPPPLLQQHSQAPTLSHPGYGRHGQRLSHADEGDMPGGAL
ncbi:hypothetical protein Hte_006494 [Hypoxylon texense]